MGIISESHIVAPELIARLVGVGNPNAPRRADAPIPDASSCSRIAVSQPRNIVAQFRVEDRRETRPSDRQ